MGVHVKPLPMAFRKIPKRLWPNPPPLFDDDPTPEERREAEALIAALDAESRAWYGR